MQTIEETAQAKPAAKKRSGKKKPGRPVGSKTADPPKSVGVLTRCPRCGSTDRGEYTSKHEIHFCGMDPNTGEPYTHKVWRRCRCKACGQLRTDITYENRTTSCVKSTSNLEHGSWLSTGKTASRSMTS